MPESSSNKTGIRGKAVSQNQSSEGSRGRTVTYWTPKGNSRTARLSHKPSMANLLAQ